MGLPGEPETVGRIGGSGTACAIVVAVSALLWSTLFVVIRPADQDFPLLDDWAFAQGALDFARGDGIHYFQWATVPQLGHWLWAAPFVWTLGGSHVSLRIATLFLSWLGLAGSFDLLRQMGWSPARAALAAGTLAVNPLFFVLQGTFMTDVPALSLSLVSLALYGRARGNSRFLFPAAAIAVLAVLTRQNALAVPMAAGCLLLRRSDGGRHRIDWWLAVAIPGAVALATHFWFEGRDDVRRVQPSLTQPAMVLLLPFWVMHTGGLASLPILILNLPRGRWKLVALACLAMAGCAAYWKSYGGLIATDGLFPYWSPVTLSVSGVSSPTLYAGMRPVLLGQMGQWLWTALGCGAGGLLLVRILERAQGGGWRSLLTGYTLLQSCFLLIVPAILDRHLLVLLPGAIFVAGAPQEASRRPRWLAGVSCLLFFAGLSLALTHDWFSWNSALWRLGRRAVTQERITSLEIEGGMEWDGWHVLQAGNSPWAKDADVRTVATARRAPSLVLAWPPGLFQEVRGTYALSFAPLPGAATVDRESYAQWLRPGAHELLLLRYRPPVLQP